MTDSEWCRGQMVSVFCAIVLLTEFQLAGLLIEPAIRAQPNDDGLSEPPHVT